MIHLQLLRDPNWFRLHQPEVGKTILLDMPEMGVEGEALDRTRCQKDRKRWPEP